MPETVAVPNEVPPVVQVVGAEDCGPKTLKVTVPEALAPDAAERTELIELVAMAAPVESVAGPVAVTVGLALATIVSAIPVPHLLAAELLFESPA